MHKIITYTFVFFFAGLSALSQNKQIEKKLDELLSGQFPQQQPGCQVLIAKQGEVIYRKAFGTADLQLGVPMKPEMVFNIASITKQFTAVAILQLEEQGKLSLQDSIRKFIPDYPPKGYNITIEHLLTHTSGIPDYMQIDYRSPSMERWDFSPRQLIDSFKSHPLQFEPGTRYSYSNSGYYILGYIIQIVSGKSYQEYIRTNLLDPLEMKQTWFDQDGILIPNRVRGYEKSGATFKNESYWSPTIEYSAGGLISNVDDLFRWHKGLHSYKILKKETLERAFRPYRVKDGSSTEYGYGWNIRTTNGIRSIEHQGGLPAFVTNEIYYPEQDVFIAILCNTRAPIDELSASISGIALGRSMQPSVTVEDKILDSYVGTYQLTIDRNRKMTIQKEGKQLVAVVSTKEKVPLVFQSDTKFQFKGLLNAACEFVVENGKAVKFVVEQNGHYEWTRIE